MRYPIEDGIVDRNKLCGSASRVMAVRNPSVVGIVDVNLLFPIRNDFITVSCPILEGIEDVKKFKRNQSTVNAVRHPIDVGISLVNELELSRSAWRLVR